MTATINLTLTISIYDADADRLDITTWSLLQTLKDFDLEFIERKKNGLAPHRAKGDAITLGAIALGIAVASLPSLIGFLQNWMNERRRVSLEAPNGAKVDFVPEKKLSEEEILMLVEKSNKL